MKIDSLAFIVFLPTVFILYRLFPSRLRWFVLLVASYIFIGFSAPVLAFVAFAVTFVTFFSAKKIEDAVEKTTKKIFLAVSVITSIGVLFIYKYLEFFANEIIAFINFVGLAVDDLTLNLIIPVGISFFSLRAISYSVDVYRKRMVPEKHFGYYALYLCFFPTLLVCPIEKPAEFISQLKAKKPFAGYDGALALKLLTCGFFKVIVVARQVAIIVDRVYSGIGSIDVNLMNGFTVLLATALFAIQIYCDFSGYYDIAVGCSLLFGIKLSENFRAPYLANGIKDFLNRWNISVNAWFKEYVYDPVNGNSESGIKRYFSLAVVFLLGGLWYGAGWTFLILGAAVFALFVLGDIVEQPRIKFFDRIGAKSDGKMIRVLKRIWLTLVMLIFAMLIRAEDMKDLGLLLKTLFTGWGAISLSASINAVGMSLISVLTTAISVYAAILLDKQIAMKKNDLRYNSAVRAERLQAYTVVTWTIVIAFLIILVSNGMGMYPYFNF